MSEPGWAAIELKPGAEFSVLAHEAYYATLDRLGSRHLKYLYRLFCEYLPDHASWGGEHIHLVLYRLHSLWCLVWAVDHYEETSFSGVVKLPAWMQQAMEVLGAEDSGVELMDSARQILVVSFAAIHPATARSLLRQFQKHGRKLSTSR